MIVLGIIGVVSAITLPSIISNHQKKVTATRLKQACSILSQALEQAETVNGEIINWDFDNQFFEKYLIPNIKKITKHNLPKNGTLGITYREISGNPENGLALMRGLNGNTKIYTLANGTQIFFVNSNNDTTKDVIVDLNGFAKPNQFGKDLFYFYITKERKLQPMGLYSSSECKHQSEPAGRNILKGNSCLRYGCNKNGRGMWCGALIMTDGWKISPDYPW